MNAPRAPAALWRGLDELEGSDEVARLVEAEFPAAAFAEGVDRRGLLRVMAASLLLAALPGCDDDSGDAAIPYVEQPEQEVPGVPRLYATAVTLAGIAQPVLGTTYSGRPTKLEGNPQHPASGGATDAFTQATVLGLYDPDRSQAPSVDGRPATWAEAEATVAELRQRWIGSKGAGLRILTGATTSPTLIRQFGELLTALPEARIHVLEPATPEAEPAGTTLAFGRPLDVRHDFAKARAIVALDADFLGPGPFQVVNTRSWTAARAASERPHLYVAESTPSLTGAAANARFPAAPARIEHLAHAIAAGIGLGPEIDLTRAEQAWAGRAVLALKAAGSAALVTIGAHHPPQLQALVHRINAALGSAGTAVRYAEPLVYRPPGDASLAALARDMEAGKVETLVVLDANPVYAAPGDLRFAELLRRVPTRIHAGLYRDETAALCGWHLPLTHALESWSDARAADGAATVIQPLVRPFFAARTIHQVLDLVLGNKGDDARGLVFATWRARFGADPDAKWRQSLNDGFIADTAAAPVDVLPAPQAGAVPPPPSVPAGSVEIVFRPDPGAWDGRFANNAWLQEMPRPLTTITWDAPVLVSPAFAAANGIENGDVVEIAAGDRALSGPAWALPGQAENTITLFLGYGRWQAGRVGNGRGYHAASLQRSAAPWQIAAASWRKTGKRRPLAATQLQHGMEGEDLVLTVAPGAAVPRPQTPPTLYPKWPSTEARNDPSWGMVIDLDRCTGCNACALACQAENNVPVVGREQVLIGRAMHWLRIARYYRGGTDNPETLFQPVPCMHCEKAPCEQGCPVHATVHSPDGLNQMIYNRCIGTRTCSSYCPYKVRRFNFFDFTTDEPGGREPQRNPNVTVRTRGVMEKCTYCVQRISAARIVADKEDRPIRDGEVVPACQAACPAQAIAFGNIADPVSAVSQARSEGRNYTLLDHIGARPRTSYLARIADPEPGS